MLTALVIISAILLGIIAGIMPGIGIMMVVVMMYPVLMKLSVIDIFLFYVILSNTMQYYGSISSIIFGIMGESTSAPAVENGHELFKRGLGNIALASTSTSSFIASLFGIAVFWICAYYSDILITLLTGKVKVLILLLVLAILAWVSSNKFLAFVMILIGLTVGSAGSDIVIWARYIFPRYMTFDGGVPLSPLLTGFIVVPLLIEYLRKSNFSAKCEVPYLSFKSRLKYLFKTDHLASTVRGSLIGCFAGAIPGVSYTVSSNMAESVEKMLNKKKKDTDSLFKNILSAEAANNAGAVVVLAPLLLFLIPIIPSEALILNLAESNGFSYAAGSTFISNHLYSIIAVIFSANLINWWISGYCYKYIAAAYDYLEHYGYWISIILCVGMTILNGYFDNQLVYVLCVLIAATGLGFLIRSVSVKLCFIFAYFVAGELLPEIYRQYLLYFT